MKAILYMKDRYSHIKTRIEADVERLSAWYGSASKRDRNRFLILLISLLFIMDYLMFCYHADKNVFNIFPSIPLLDTKSTIKVYLPDVDGKSILREIRKVDVQDEKEEHIKSLFNMVVQGFYFDNTTHLVPVNTFVRKVWVYGDQCVIDVDLSEIKDDVKVVPGSEETFKKALDQTIRENVPSVKSVQILVNGLPGRVLWETGDSGKKG